jgi:hypothetical protein
MMSFCFRVRFKLGDGVKLESSHSEIVLTDDRDLPELVTLKPWGNALTLGDARQLVLRGEGYESEQHALESAGCWNARLQAALARCNIGADFGVRAPQGVFTEQGLAIAAGALGRVVLNDVHGTAVFASEPQPTFLGLGAATLMLGKPAERLSQAIRAVRDLGVALSDQEQLAYDLYGASFFFHPSPDVRFVMLMMALETLAEPQERGPEVVTHVDALIAFTHKSGLPDNEIASIAGSLEYLRKESIGQAGRRLARTLGERRYMDETATQFFTECYALRSRLVHGHYPRPTRSEVDLRAAHLETFVSHLLSGQLLNSLSD